MSAVKVKAEPLAYLDMKVFRAKTGTWEILPRIGLPSTWVKLLKKLKGK